MTPDLISYDALKDFNNPRISFGSLSARASVICDSSITNSILIFL